MHGEEYHTHKEESRPIYEVLLVAPRVNEEISCYKEISWVGVLALRASEGQS